jgi:hypothetical protein
LNKLSADKEYLTKKKDIQIYNHTSHTKIENIIVSDIQEQERKYIERELQIRMLETSNQ